MIAPTRALVVEDIDNWIYILDRAARRAGASEVVVCKDLRAVEDALLRARFDVAILDVGLDPDDNFNKDGIKALEAIRETDDGSTRCVLVTGWEGGDRLDLHARAQQQYGVDWAYMKEKYEAHQVIAKLTELLEQASARRLSQSTPMANLCAGVEPFMFEDKLINTLFPTGGVKTVYSLVSRLLSSAIPLVAMYPSAPMQHGEGGTWVGLYWSRSLATAMAIGLASAGGWHQAEDKNKVPADLRRVLGANVEADLIESVRERNVEGRVWELPGLDRDKFAG